MQHSAANTADYSARFNATGSQTFRVDTNAQSVTYTTGLVGSGSTFAKLGTGTLTLTGANTYNGGTTISAGTLQIGNGGTSGSVNGIITNNAALVFNRSDASNFTGIINGIGSVTVQGGGTVTLTSISAASAYSGATTLNGGSLTINAGASASQTSSVGVTNGTLRVNGALGTILTPTAVTLNSGGRLGGSGTVNGTVSVASGGILAPGNSTGTLTTGNETWAGGGSYTFEINNATGTAGGASGWDLVQGVSGLTTLNITATNSNKFAINVFSLGLDQNPGSATNFVNTNSYTWKIADFDGGITGFSADKFVVNSSSPNGNFQNSTAGGTFGVGIGGTNNSELYLTFTPAPVPEPATVLAIGAAGLGVVGAVRRRRRAEVATPAVGV